MGGGGAAAEVVPPHLDLDPFRRFWRRPVEPPKLGEGLLKLLRGLLPLLGLGFLGLGLLRLLGLALVEAPPFPEPSKLPQRRGAGPKRPNRGGLGMGRWGWGGR